MCVQRHFAAGLLAAAAIVHGASDAAAGDGLIVQPAVQGQFALEGESAVPVQTAVQSTIGDAVQVEPVGWRVRSRAYFGYRPRYYGTYYRGWGGYAYRPRYYYGYGYGYRPAYYYPTYSAYGYGYGYSPYYTGYRSYGGISVNVGRVGIGVATGYRGYPVYHGYSYNYYPRYGYYSGSAYPYYYSYGGGYIYGY